MKNVIGVTKDTLVYVFTEHPMTRISIRLEDLYGRWCEGEDFKTYTYNPSTKKRELNYITNVHLGSEYQDNLLNIYLDSRCGVRCTKDCEILLSDGTYRKASDLKLGDELASIRNWNSKIVDIKSIKDKIVGYVTVDSDDGNYVLGNGNVIARLPEATEIEDEVDDTTKFFRSIYSDFDSSDTKLVGTNLDDNEDGSSNVTFSFSKNGEMIDVTTRIEPHQFTEMIEAIDNLIKLGKQ